MKLAEQSDWQQRGKTSRSKERLTKQEREDRKAYREDMWELKGAFYAFLALSILAGPYYFFCLKKQNARERPVQYSQVM